ncbi:MAG: aminopeptidase [Lachnospiraceae bacterium]|nr:aminopeptidase [Lachnospiraceae bacterium]
MTERFELALERIKECAAEQFPLEAYDAYFKEVSGFLLELCQQYAQIAAGELDVAGTASKDVSHASGVAALLDKPVSENISENSPVAAGLSIKKLQMLNEKLYHAALPEQYESSFLNPACAVGKLGQEFGRLLSCLYAELRKGIVYAYEQKLELLTIRLELFLEVYSAFVYEMQENGTLPSYENIRQIGYWFISDYSDIETADRIRAQVCPEDNLYVDIIMNSDLSDLRYLYRYGVYISDNEMRIASYLNEQPEEKIQLMAHTYVEGYRKGFEMAGKDLSRKKTAGLYYHVGFERMMREAVKELRDLGLEPTVYRAWVDGAAFNRQYAFDHRDDMGLFWDKQLLHRMADVLKNAFEEVKEAAGAYAGPAVVEVFGEPPFAPVSKPECVSMSEEARKVFVEYRSQSGEITNQYIKGEERSFTIIAFPLPEIGEPFEEIFDEIIRINTLDYELYKNIQQHIIDALDEADYVEIKGMGANETDLCIKLHELKDKSKETNFENCVADVNIPVGEVFTSPVLTGTNGVLHVSRVFLNELEYQNLRMEFQDGMISAYSCTNFEAEADNRKYIKDNVLFRHDTLPMGEFAIGTNTTAYVTAEKYGIAHKLPILIAEKMGPHFAVGDTCYSHQEEVKMFNPDGKEVIARDNEVSLKRLTDGSKAYYNCHTDITIPYDELGSIVAVCADGSRISIIEQGRFVLPGCEMLNEPFEDA